MAGSVVCEQHGELVFAPLAIVLGLIVVAFAVFKPEWLVAKRPERKRHN